MQYPFKTRKVDALVFLSIFHIDQRNDSRLAPGAYVARFSGSREDTLWGTCSVKNSETIFAYAIEHIVHHHYDNGGADPFSIEIFVPKAGFKSYIDRYVPRWIQNRGLNSSGIQPDAYEQWKYTYGLYHQGNIRINHLSRQHADGAYVDLDKSVRQLAEYCLGQNRWKDVGLVEKGDQQFPWDMK